MLTDSVDRSALLQQLSALADGQLDETQVVHACQHWRGDAELRTSWHAYQLIGDVLRSEDLSSDPAHDAGFLASFRARLADEPVVFAPSPSPSPRIADAARPLAHGSPGRRWAWMTPTAVAAGFAAVAGVLFVTRVPDAGFAAPSATAVPALARASAPAGGFETASIALPAAPPPPADPQMGVASGALIRDVRLDRYLSAHKEFAGSSALGVPSGFLRNATADASDR